VKDARDLLDKMALSKQDVFSQDNARGAVAKVRILILWVLRHSQRQQDWAKVSPNKKVEYDVETRWNSTHDMIQAFLKLRKEWDKFIADHPQLEALAISDHEYILLAQIVKVLNPFKVHTSLMSEECATLMSSLAIY